MGEDDDEAAGIASEEDEDNEDGQVEESSGTMGEQCNGYQVSPSSKKPGHQRKLKGWKKGGGTSKKH